MFTRRRSQNSEERSGSAEDGTKLDKSMPPRYLFFFRGRRRSVQSAGSRSKGNSALEFWFLLAVATALLAIVVLVCLRSMTAF
jgi:hypothetical protein